MKPGMLLSQRRVCRQAREQDGRVGCGSRKRGHILEEVGQACAVHHVGVVQDEVLVVGVVCKCREQALVDELFAIQVLK